MGEGEQSKNDEEYHYAVGVPPANQHHDKRR